ncbi:MAG: SBBP repeat-containing protein, partial [Bryobacteraceae bacterium]
MALRAALLVLFLILPGFPQNSRADRPFGAFRGESIGTLSFGGSGNDSINAVTVDSTGNIYVVGTTSSFDFPLTNPFQSANTGTQLTFSSDAGATWQPLGTPFPADSSVWIATDPTNGQIVYAASGNSICKSTDGARQFNCVTIAFASHQTTITSLAIDPQQPLTLYASASPTGGVFKSVDGGATWANASQGFPPQGLIDSVMIDPFHTNVLYAWTDNGAFVSTDGAASWTGSSLPWPQNVSVSSGVRFTFDPVTPGIIYGPGYAYSQVSIQKSTDDGATWTQLNIPFIGSSVVPDPMVSGLLYALAPPTNSQSPSFPFWKSSDGGSTWTPYPCPADSLGVLAVDPANPQIMLAGEFRSTDGGQTWSPTTVSRDIQPVFAPSSAGLVYATAPITSDAFLAKFLPDGKTLVFSTYFGGMGNDTGQGIALDPSGNIWITGSTSSYDLPVTPGAFQSTLHGTTNGFAAKFSNDGNLLAATYLGGSSNDSVLGIAIGSQGNPWLIGNWSSADFPFTTAPPATLPVMPVGFLSELDPSAARLLYSTNIGAGFDQNGKGIAIDSSGNITLTGSVFGAFPVTPGAFQAGEASADASKIFVVKLTTSGSVIYSTFFGGSAGSPTAGGYEPSEDYGVAVAVDNAGNAYLTGHTSDTDFPTMPGAYQATLAAGCTYPAFSWATGVIGSVYTWLVDDVFVAKLSPDGKSALFSTLLGGSCYDRPTSIALDAVGRIYVTGETDSGDFPLVSSLEPTPQSP